MPLAEDVKNIVNDIVGSYETKIRSVGAIFDTTHQLLQTFQDSFLDTKQQREKLKAQLREILAKNGSLRKKDFDNMMQEILSNQDKRERQVRDLLNSYLNGQQEMAHSLRNNLANIKDALAKGEAQRAKEFQTVIKDILAEQERRKEEAIFKLREFQKEQQETARMLKNLLAKGKELRAKDLKLMLAEFKREPKWEYQLV
jgi:molecular chaperone DnaK (HSP70)